MVDFSGINDPQVAFAAIEEVRALVARQPRGSLLTLTDVTGSSYTPRVLEAVRDLAIHNRPDVRAAAVVGAAGALQVGLSMIAQFSGRTFGTFAEVEKAKDWLVEQAAATPS